MKKFCIVILVAMCTSTLDIYALPDKAWNLFEKTSGDTIKVKTKKAPRQLKTIAVKDYSRYQNIYELIRGECFNLKVDGSNVYNAKNSSFSLTMQVLYVVDGVIISDISYISPVEVERLEFYDDYRASAYGSRGANGILEIRLKTK